MGGRERPKGEDKPVVFKGTEVLEEMHRKIWKILVKNYLRLKRKPKAVTPLPTS